MANKNIIMLKCFLGILTNNQKSISTVIPNMYEKNIHSIDYKYLQKKGLTNIIFDIDNTILEVNSTHVPSNITSLFEKLKKQNFNIILLSNNKEKRILPVANKLKCKYISKANKPNKIAYKKALKALKSSKTNTIMVGDQMLSDIKGANEIGIYTILVEPVKDKYCLKTKTNRILQNIIIKKLEKQKKFKRYEYYKKKNQN